MEPVTLKMKKINIITIKWLQYSTEARICIQKLQITGYAVLLPQ